MSAPDPSGIAIHMPEPIAVPDGAGRMTPLPMGVFIPGTDVVIRVEILQPDHKTRGAMVELGYVNTFQQRRHDADGGSNDVTVERWVPVQQVPIPPAQGPAAVRLVVPRHAPPTVSKRISWRIRATLDRTRGFDRKAEAVVTVLTVRGMYDAWQLTMPRPASRIPLWLELYEVPHLHRGEVLSGNVVGESRIQKNLTGIRMDVVNTLHTRGETDRNTRAFSMPLSGPLTTFPGQRWHFPFRLFLPPDLEPNHVAQFTSSQWYIHLVADIPMAKDEVSQIEFTLT